ncbi:Uncharacterised protein [Mycobacteroides abscessus subsp. abscessus]|nr:Uncharacterised protein [Mycobacteroides abscessus subsp. abscessus]
MTAVRWHTEGRRQPQIIGRDSAGKKIPGGPYTIYQVAGLAMLPLLGSTQQWWGAGLSPLVCWLVIIPSVTALSVWLLGMPDFSRNPLLAVGPTATLMATSLLLARPRTPTKANQVIVWGTGPEGTDGSVQPADLKVPAAAQNHGTVHTASVLDLLGDGLDEAPNHLETPGHDEPLVPVQHELPLDQVLSPLQAFLAAANKE